MLLLAKGLIVHPIICIHFLPENLYETLVY